MSDLILIQIGDAYNSTYRCRNSIAAMGFTFNKDAKVWEKEVPPEKVPEIEAFCDKNKLSFLSPKTIRSSDYRKNFFEAVPPLKNNKYRCVYCGRKLKKDKITIDHLIGIKKAQTSGKFRKKLYNNGCTSVNDIKNLVPACNHCNVTKGTHVYPWLWRAKIGKSERFWHICNGIFYSFIVFTILFYIFSENFRL